MKYRLDDLIDIRQFQMLQDRLNEIYSFPSAIIDNEGNILTATGWQDICTQFHRANTECEAECRKSDQYILDHIHEADPAVSYRCPHGLIDNATPIIIEGVHYGNFFTGQFFLEKPDPAFFQAQAKKYGFDETAYLEAVKKVPVWTLDQLDNYLFFIRGLIEVISGIGLKNLREIETKQQIARNEKILASVLNSVPQSIFWKDTNSVYLGCNEAFARAVGLESPARIVGKTDYDLPWPRPEAESYRADDQVVMQRNRAKRHIIEPLLQADGSRLWIDTTKVPLIDATGNPYGILGVYEDITEKYLLEEERLRVQKLESIGTLAGGIAHDFNNLLQGIFGYMSMAKMSLDEPERVKALLLQAEEALHLAVNLTTQLLTFSKGGKPVKKLIRLEQVVTNAIKFALSGSQTTYVLEMPPDLWPVEVDAGQVAQVVQNIVLNANEAMDGKGSVHISAGNTEITGESIPGLPGGGRFVRIEIQDSGKGISEQNLKKIFDPYFTTKEEGSGLGLATSYSIIRNHDGIITVTSEEHRGSIFAIYLPAAKDCRRAEETAVAEGEIAKNGRILLMDDEELVRDVAQKMIMALGHEVQCAENGETTIDLFRQARETGNPFEVVILDLTVKGGMGGEETINKLRSIDPDVVAIVSSGYAENSVVADFRTFGFSAALNKPYTLAALRDCINELL